MKETTTVFGEVQAAAREQIAAAWQLHLDRIREQLESGWQEQIDGVVAERFSEVERRFHDELERRVDEQTSQRVERSLALAHESARRQSTEEMNHTARRLRQAETREEWIRTLLDAAGRYCSRAALFVVRSKTLRFEGGIGFGAKPNGTELALGDSPAFQNAAESRDTVVAIATRRELSEPVATLLPECLDRRVYLFPVLNGKKTVGVLLADQGDDPLDVSALELLTLMAEVSMEVEVETRPAATDLVRIAGVETRLKPKPVADQEVHLRAQRFARTQVAQIVLYKMGGVKQGRANRDIYGRLRQDIDAGREAFSQQFLTASSSMVDYYHQELVRTLANDDPALLGPEYPGPFR